MLLQYFWYIPAIYTDRAKERETTFRSYLDHNGVEASNVWCGTVLKIQAFAFKPNSVLKPTSTNTEPCDSWKVM